MILRRNLANGKLTDYVCHAPRGTAPETPGRVADMRRAVEEYFEAAKES